MNTKDILKSGTKEKVFSSANVSIQKNIIRCENNFLQIRNISQAWIGQIPKPPLEITPLIILAVAGFAGLFVFVIPGLILFGILAWLIYKHVSTPDVFAINIELTSGRLYSFTSQDFNFLNYVYNIICNIVEDPNHAGDIMINFGSGSIINNSENSNIHN